MAVYYNEFDPFAAAWLRELIKAGHIADGDVDERSIEDVIPNDVMGYTQCHFFAGIGGWSYALRLAGWPDDRPVWTGSCPCQPFSAAGKGAGFADERHLWPTWFHLIRVSRPANVFGEQVASKDGLAWLDLVQADLEGENYRCGAQDLCAAGVGAPHIRQRQWIVADTPSIRRAERRPTETIQIQGKRSERGGEYKRSKQDRQFPRGSEGLCSISELANSPDQRHDRRRTSQESDGRNSPWIEPERLCTPSGVALGDTDHKGLQIRISNGRLQRIEMESPERQALISAGATNGYWGDADWIYCRDQKYRPVEPDTFPLAHGATNRVGRLRGYGNAIAPRVAKEVIEAYMSLENGQENNSAS